MLEYSLMDGQPYSTDMMDGQTCQLVRRLDNPRISTSVSFLQYMVVTVANA
jgi:hypothetical protein